MILPPAAPESTGLIEFGVGFGGTLPPADYTELAQLLEDRGFHVATVFGDLMMQPPAFPLATMARATSSLRLGVGCYTPWTLHPVEMAGQLAYLDHLSGGRIFMGIVRGAWMGQLRIEQKNALDAVYDSVAIVRCLLRGSGEGHQGKVFQLAPGMRPEYPVLRPEIPLMVGTWSPKLSAYAGKHADEIQVGGCANAAMVPVIRGLIAKGAEPAGRPDGEPRIVLTAVTVVDEDGAAARAAARTMVALPFHVIAKMDTTFEVDDEVLDRMAPLLRAGQYEEAGRLIPDDTLTKFSFCGTPAEVTEQAMSIYAAGATRIEFDSPFGLTPRSGIELLADKVLPALREAFSDRLLPIDRKASR